MNLNKEKIYAIVKAYDNGMTLPGLSMMFKISKHDTINIVHLIKVVRKMKIK